MFNSVATDGDGGYLYRGGLFANLMESSISKVNILSGEILGYCAGSIAAETSDTSFEDCRNSVEIIAQGWGHDYDLYASAVGGFVGVFTGYGNLNNCYNYGNVIHDGSLTNDFYGYSGGFVGEILYDCVEIYNCYCYSVVLHDESFVNSGGTFVGGVLDYGQLGLYGCYYKLSGEYLNSSMIVGYTDGSTDMDIDLCLLCLYDTNYFYGEWNGNFTMGRFVWFDMDGNVQYNEGRFDYSDWTEFNDSLYPPDLHWIS